MKYNIGIDNGGTMTKAALPLHVHNAVVLEEVAKMAFYTQFHMGGNPQQMQQEFLSKHFYRKHRENAYFGQ